MKKIITLAVILAITSINIKKCHSQGVEPSDWGLQNISINDQELGLINIYITEKGISEEKPLLFMPQGCGGLPTMLVVTHVGGSTQLGTLSPDQINSFANYFHVAYIAKAGTPFCDTVEVEKLDNPYAILEGYKPSEEYLQKCGMEWQISAGIKAIDTLCKLLPVKDKKIIALGISEGGRVVTQIAAQCPAITHLVSIVSGGLNQFYSSIINRRLDAASGVMSHEEAQREIDSLLATYKRIYRDPMSTEKWYYGHPYKRWGSFCNDIPLETLVKLDIPIFMVQGTADRSNPILQSDYVMLEFIRHGKTNLTYHVMPGCDHQFYCEIEENGKKKRISKRKEAFDSVIQWYTQLENAN